MSTRVKRPVSQKAARYLLRDVEKASDAYTADPNEETRNDYFATLVRLHGTLSYYTDPNYLQMKERPATKVTGTLSASTDGGYPAADAQTNDTTEVRA